MRTIDIASTPTPVLHQHLVSVVNPRPICFASTISADGIPNLAPYSFFNVFSSNPPTAIFSSNRRVSNNTTKDTLANVAATKEVVINVVPYSMVRQMALASVDYPANVDEFKKAGLTPIASDLVRPFRVKESPVQMECVVQEIKQLGDSGGAGNLIICEIIRLHISEQVFDAEDKIDPDKMDLVGRMGRAFYCRASGEAIYKIYQPFKQLGVGFDALPAAIKQSTILTGNDLAQLAARTSLPSAATINTAFKENPNWQSLNDTKEIHYTAKQLITNGKVKDAFCLLMGQL